MLAALLILASGCASVPRRQPSPYPTPEQRDLTHLMLTVRVGEEGQAARLVAVPLEEYVAGCVAAELGTQKLDTPAAQHLQQVQALVCRTYAIANLGRHAAEGFDLCTSVHCQRYRAVRRREPRDLQLQAAIAPTQGSVIVYQGKPIQALFHANCGGRTSGADAVWGGRAEPYLQPVHDRYCSRLEGARWEFAVKRDRLAEVLNRDPRTAVGTAIDRIDVLERDRSGRAVRIAVGGGRRTRVVRGEEFRQILTATFGPLSIKSTWLQVRTHSGSVVFTGRGYGHGVGLCQAGAAERTRAGDTPAAIIEYYFPGTYLARLSSTRRGTQ